MLLTAARTRLRVVGISKILMQQPAILALHKDIAQRIELLNRGLRRLIAEEQVPFVKDVHRHRKSLVALDAFVVIPDSTLSGIDDLMTKRTGNSRATRPDPSARFHQRPEQSSRIEE